MSRLSWEKANRELVEQERRAALGAEQQRKAKAANDARLQLIDEELRRLCKQITHDFVQPFLRAMERAGNPGCYKVTRDWAGRKLPRDSRSIGHWGDRLPGRYDGAGAVSFHISTNGTWSIEYIVSIVHGYDQEITRATLDSSIPNRKPGPPYYNTKGDEVPQQAVESFIVWLAQLMRSNGVPVPRD